MTLNYQQLKLSVSTFCPESVCVSVVVVCSDKFVLFCLCSGRVVDQWVVFLYRAYVVYLLVFCIMH